MIQKQFTPKRTICKVTFTVPEDWAEKEVAVVGDFNDWDPSANKLEKKNGAWETVVRLAPSSEYQFRYFIDGSNWANDDSADTYAPNEHGTENSVVVIGN